MFKKSQFSLFIGISWLLCSCSSNKPADKVFGEQVDTLKAIPVASLAGELSGKTSVNTIVYGTVSDVCKAEGCWLKLDLGGEKSLMVKMKGHSFTVTEDIQGKKAFIKGNAFYDTTSVEKLRHYAEDDGESPEKIAAITEPKVEVIMEASGVLVH